MRARPKRWSLVLLLMAATLVTYWRAPFCDFTLWDDPDTIAANPRLNPPNLSAVLHYWTHSAGGLYIPLTYTFWIALSAMGMHPAIFHGANVLLHVASVLLVYSILRQLLERENAACIGAMLFAVHPLQVESVAWTSGTKDLLAGLLSLLTIDQVLRRRYSIAFIAMMLAVLAKPSAVVAPLIAAVLARARFGASVRQISRWLAPMLAVSIACAIWSRFAQTAHPPTHSPLWARPLIAADAVAFYLMKLVWPTNLGIIYGRTPPTMLRDPALYLTWMAPAVVGMLAWKLRRSHRWVTVGAIVFLFGLLPVLGFTRFEFQVHSTVADHYLYLAMLGVSIAAAGLVAHHLRWPFIVLSAAGLTTLAALSMAQLRHWRDSESLFTQALRVNPRSVVARDALGRAYASAGKLVAAIEQFRIAVGMAPASRLARTNLAQALLQAGRIDDAIAELETALRLAGPDEDVSREHFLLEQARRAVSTSNPSGLSVP